MQVSLLGIAVSGAWRRSEVAACLSRVARSRQQHAVLALWRAQSELIESQDLTSGLQDAVSRLLCYVQGNNLQINCQTNSIKFCDVLCVRFFLNKKTVDLQ